MSPRQGFPVPRELLPPHIGCCQSSATSIFQLPRHRRSMLGHQSDGLECAAWRPLRPVTQCRQFQEDAKDASVSECTWTLSALEALRNALYKFKTYLLTFSSPSSVFSLYAELKKKLFSVYLKDVFKHASFTSTATECKSGALYRLNSTEILQQMPCFAIVTCSDTGG